jgi:hypothetical protein
MYVYKKAKWTLKGFFFKGSGHFCAVKILMF